MHKREEILQKRIEIRLIYSLQVPLLVKKSDSDDEIRIDDSVEGDSNTTEEYITLSSEQKEDLIDKLESKFIFNSL